MSRQRKMQGMPEQKMLLLFASQPPKAKVSGRATATTQCRKARSWCWHGKEGCGKETAVRCKDSGVTSIIVKCSEAFLQLQFSLAPRPATEPLCPASSLPPFRSLLALQNQSNSSLPVGSSIAILFALVAWHFYFLTRLWQLLLASTHTFLNFVLATCHAAAP